MTDHLAVVGFRPKPRYREVVCDWEDLAPDEGCPPLTAKILANPTFALLDAIPSVYVAREDGEGLLIRVTEALRVAIAPMVVEWNCTAVDLKTGDVVHVPPPGEIGPDAFRVVDWQVAAWLGIRIKNVHREAVDPKLLARSDAGPETADDETSD